MSYEKRIDRLHPALIIVVVDQSDSMNEVIEGGSASKAEAVADQINALLQELVLRCTKSSRELPRAYFFVGVIGYSTTPRGEPLVESALAMATRDGLVSSTDLASQPLRIATQVGPEGGEINSPIWVEPVARGGTPMCAALNQAGQLAADWVAHHPDSFPPLILNLSDGEATDGDPGVWASRLRSVCTTDGQALLFNLGFSTSRSTVSLFPSHIGALGDAYAEKLFHMSSPLPPTMIATARSRGLDVSSGAHGFAYHADIRALATFMNVGTAIGMVPR